MTSVPPSLPPQALQPAPLPAPTVATIAAPPPVPVQAALQAMAVNDTVTAAVLDASNKAAVTVETPAGTLTLRLPMPLPAGAQITLQLLSSGNQPQFKVIALNGQPVAPNGQPMVAKTVLGVAAQTTASATTATTSLLQPPPAEPAGIIARVVSPPSPAPGNATPTLPTGTSLVVRLASVELPPAPAPSQPADPAQPPAQATPPNAQPGTAPPPSLSSPEAAAAGQPPPPAAGTPQPPSAAPPPPTAAPQAAAPTAPPPATDTPAAPPPTPTTLSGVVAANSRPANLLVQTQVGLLSLDAVVELPPGTKVELDVVGQPVPPPKAPPTAPRPPFPMFQEALETLRQAEPQLVQQLLARLPQVGPKLAAQMAVLSGAALRGSAEEWLGAPLLKALEKAKRADLLTSLDEEVEAMKSPTALPHGGNDWQAYLLPLMFNEQMERVRLVVRRPPENEQEAEARDEEGTRFLVDVEMSRLGAVQLDGLVKGRVKRFDLIIRTHQALPETMRRDIGGIFSNALDGFGMTGSASFQTTPQFVEPVPISAQQGAGLMI